MWEDVNEKEQMRMHQWKGDMHVRILEWKSTWMRMPAMKKGHAYEKTWMKKNKWECSNENGTCMWEDLNERGHKWECSNVKGTCMWEDLNEKEQMRMQQCKGDMHVRRLEWKKT